MTVVDKFNLPLDFSRLENDRLRLVPYEDNLKEWADIYIQDSLQNQQVFDWLNFGPFADTAEYLSWYEENLAKKPEVIFFAILLKAGTVERKDSVTGEMTTIEVADGTFAGLSGLFGMPENATAELGQMLVSRFHRTFVGTETNALLLHYCLDSAAQGGLGLRRVQWTANTSNAASIAAAKRLGFQWEGITRWQRVQRVGKKASEGAGLDREGLPRAGWDGSEWGPGRHTATLSLCWDDWLGGGRDHLDALVRR